MNEIQKVLLCDDEPLMLKFMQEVCKRKGIETHISSNGQEAIEKIKQHSYDCIISDVVMPLKSGIDVLKFCKKHSPETLVILVTANGTVETCVEAMKLGAFHYLIKPFSFENLENVLEKAKEHIYLLKQNSFFKQLQKPNDLFANSPQMLKIIKSIDKIAKSNASVFITGESGTGKEVIASYIHSKSLRAAETFVKVNCAAIAETLVESEFFGHEKGAFTGAIMRKIGRFEMADRGTLLLDEVTEIPISLQPKLLRAIQEQEFERVGGIKPLKVNIRFIATSNRNMQDAIESKIFREDLFYRLNVVPIHIPPLRERKEDIICLAEFFIDKFCKENHKKHKQITQEAKEKLLNYPWPGNVRELANIIERTIVLDFDDLIKADHLHLDHPSSTKVLTSGFTLYEMEKKFILQTLLQYGNNRTKAASILGISAKTLRNKLHEYELSASLENE